MRHGNPSLSPGRFAASLVYARILKAKTCIAIAHMFPDGSASSRGCLSRLLAPLRTTIEAARRNDYTRNEFLELRTFLEESRERERERERGGHLTAVFFIIFETKR